MNFFSADKIRMDMAEAAIRKACDVERRELRGDKTFQFIGDFHLIFTKRFFRALHVAATVSGEGHYQLICLEPNPTTYYHAHFGVFPLCHLCATDDPVDVLRGLGQDPGGSPADAINSRGDTIALISANPAWLVLATRDDHSLRAGFLSEVASITFSEQLHRSS